MAKIGTVTFHGAQNFGSVLQTYALQEFVLCILDFSNANLSTCLANLRIEFLLVVCYYEITGSESRG